MPLKCVSINVERSKHLDLVLPFLESEAPDVVCVQELCEEDVPRLATASSSAGVEFAPMSRYVESGTSRVIGLGMFSREPIARKRIVTYYEHSDALPECDNDDASTYNNVNRCLLFGDVGLEGDFRLITTHFTWSPKGMATDAQRKDVTNMLHELDSLGDFVLCGDFNAPRGGEIFAMLASRYKDNIPPEYKTSIDVGLHRAGKARPEELADKMVDGLFSTPHYVVSDVRLVSGVSDHCAIVFKIATAT